MEPETITFMVDGEPQVFIKEHFELAKITVEDFGDLRQGGCQRPVKTLLDIGIPDARLLCLLAQRELRDEMWDRTVDEDYWKYRMSLDGTELEVFLDEHLRVTRRRRWEDEIEAVCFTGTPCFHYRQGSGALGWYASKYI